MNERIKKVRKESGLNMEEFAKRIGITRSSISRIESGENNPSEQTVILICKEFKVRYQWLTDGIEPMYEELDSECMTRIDAIMTSENEFAKSLFKAFSKLDTDEWKLLKKLIDELKNELMN